MQVARINSNKWAVAVSGFNNLFADKVLVLIDGRTMYDRLNSGVFWESLDVPLDLIERIEVIRGPGGATWGANAVNGVINIVTKSAVDTPGAAVMVSGGTFDGTAGVGAIRRHVGRTWPIGSIRNGRAAASRRSMRTPPPTMRGRARPTGVRLDWNRNAETLMVEAGATLASLRGLWHAPSGPVPAVKAPFDAAVRDARIPRARPLDARPGEPLVAGSAVVRQLQAQPGHREPAAVAGRR